MLMTMAELMFICFTCSVLGALIGLNIAMLITFKRR
jgi:hypothetical protein